MRMSSSLIRSLVLLVVMSSLYRIMPERPLGFAPQIAIALFAGSIIPVRKWSFAVPLGAMLISDLLYEGLFQAGASTIPGFYSGQWINYLLFLSITFIGFAIKPGKPAFIAGGALAGTIYFFLASNFAVWIGGGLDINNIPYPKTWEGLMQCYTAGLPFLRGSLLATFLFSGLFFGAYQWWNSRQAVAAGSKVA